MLAAIEPDDEAERIAALRSLKIFDTAPEERFDRLTRLAKRLFDVPITLVSLVDENRQWFKSCVGINTRETSRDISFCAHAITSRDILVVPDARLDVRFHDNPLGKVCISGAGLSCQIDRRLRRLWNETS